MIGIRAANGRWMNGNQSGGSFAKRRRRLRKCIAEELAFCAEEHIQEDNEDNGAEIHTLESTDAQTINGTNDTSISTKLFTASYAEDMTILTLNKPR